LQIHQIYVFIASHVIIKRDSRQTMLKKIVTRDQCRGKGK